MVDPGDDEPQRALVIGGVDSIEPTDPTIGVGRTGQPPARRRRAFHLDCGATDDEITEPALASRFPGLVRSAVNFVIDSMRTSRTWIKELGTFERTILGRKVEHFILDYLDTPWGHAGGTGWW
jgi:hypothetical protein